MGDVVQLPRMILQYLQLIGQLVEIGSEYDSGSFQSGRFGEELNYYFDQIRLEMQKAKEDAV